MEDYPGYSSAPPAWARLRPTRAASMATDTWSAKPSTHAGVNADRNPAAPLPRKVLKAKLPGAPQAPAPVRASSSQGHVQAPTQAPSWATHGGTPSRTSRSTNSSSQWANSIPRPRELPAVLEMTEDESPDFDTSETASISSEVSISTQATSVASDDTVTAKDGSKLGPRNALKVIHPAPTATLARVKPRPRTRPLTSSAELAATSTTPRSPAHSSRRTLHIQVLPSQDSQHQKKAEKDMRLKLEQLEAETQSLRDEQTRLLQELDSTSDRLSTTGQEKEEAEKERNRERDTRQLLYSDLEDQRKTLSEFRTKYAEQKVATKGVENERDLVRSDLDKLRHILDEFRSNFELQKGMLDALEKERDELKETKESLEQETAKLAKEFKEAKGERKESETLLVAKIAALELAKEALEGRIDTHTKEVIDLTVARDTFEKESKQHEAQLKSTVEEKEAWTEEKKTLETRIAEEKRALETRIAEMVEEREEEEQVLQTKLDSATSDVDRLSQEVEKLTEEKTALDEQVESLEAGKKEQQATMDTLMTDLGGVKDANISLASQRLNADKEAGQFKEELAGAHAELAKLQETNKALESENEELKARPAEVIEVQVPAPAPEAPEPEAPIPAPDSSAGDELAAEVAKVVGLTAAKAELETKISELQAEADKAAGFAEEKEKLVGEKAELERQAGEIPGLTEQNNVLSGQLAMANNRLAQVQAAYQAATAQVQDLQAQVAALRARQPSQSRSNSRKRKASSADSKTLVVVRNPQDKGSL